MSSDSPISASGQQIAALIALRPGEIVSGYVIEKEIGAGGFGIVYRGFNSGLRRYAAIKEFFPKAFAYRSGSTVVLRDEKDRGTFEKVLRKFEETTGFLSHLKHPNIVEVLNYEAKNGTAYMVMEYVEGVTLIDWREMLGRAPTEIEIRAIFEPILDAVAYLHGKGLIHRDISPMNIMLRSGTGRPALIDFGTMKQFLQDEARRDQPGSSVIICNVAYAAMEQLSRDSARHGAFTDVHALAASMYHMMAGAPPVSAEDRKIAMVFDNKPDPYAPLAQAAQTLASPQVYAAIDRGLALQPEKRTQTIADFLRDLGWSFGASVSVDGSARIASDRLRSGEQQTQPLPPPLPPATAAQPQALAELPPAPPPLPAGESGPRPEALPPVELTVSPAVPLPQGRVGKALNAVVAVISGGQPPYAADVAGLPQGVTASVDGSLVRISGAPAALGFYGYGVFVRDAAGASRHLGNQSLQVKGEGSYLPLAAAIAILLMGAGGALLLWDREPAAPADGVVETDPRPAPRPDARQAAAGDCDRLAGSPWDRNKVADGVESEQVDVAAAEAACRAAREARPAEPRFQFQLARVLHLRKDYAGARALYQPLADKGHSAASANLAQLHYFGRGGARDVAAAVTLYRAAADKGNAVAQHNLGDLHERGDGVARDVAQAALLYRQAADQGYLPAMVSLGRLHEEGQGAAKNEAEAARWYRLAVDKDYAPALTSLGLLYFQGRGVAKDADEAVRLFRAAAEKGDGRAMNLIGLSYSQGAGNPRNDAEAFAWFRRAAEAGNADAMNSVGFAYDTGAGVASNQSEAFRWYRRAAALGLPAALYNVGLSYDNGLGVPENDREAIGWYRRAADKGHGGAMTNLGFLYERGLGVSKDETEAVRWYRRAAEAGNPTGMKNLGVMLEDGRGVAQSFTEAAAWYRRAADAGNAGGMNNLGVLYESGKGVERNIQEAARWYLAAAERGDRFAMLNVASLYDGGRGVAQDSVQAARWILAALKQGHDRAVDQMKNNSSSWRIETRRELVRLLRLEGVYNGSNDGVFDAAVLRAIDEVVRRGRAQAQR